MKNLNQIFLFILCISFSISNAQNLNNQLEGINPNVNEIDFTNMNGVLVNQNFSSFLIVGIADMNGDCLDDIIRLENGKKLSIEYQLYNNQFESFVYGNVSIDPRWNIAVADVDKNGFNDILIGGISEGMKLLKANDFGTNYGSSLLPNSIFFAQGSNFSDINNDGFVDIFVCNDNGTSRIWSNDGTGNYLQELDWIDFSTNPSSDNSGNYASAWTDFDNDSDLDLYISKCRVGVTNPNDPRRVNQLFVNDNGNFTEQAEAYGLKNGAQSWTTDFQDIDNDGDLDCFIVNHDSICQLFENDGNGFFAEITSGSGLNITTNHLQGLMRDFDNDGFVDIIVAGNFGYEYFQNDGDKTFTKINDLFGDYVMSTFAVGDLNHDGFLDIYSASRIAESNDILWINDQNGNNYFAVNLVGISSNLNALGARLELYGPWGIQIREIRSGESYGIMNSFTQIFGLGAEEVIDSLVVKWPAGLKEVFNTPQINQFLTVVENDCAYPGKYISSNGITTLCSGDSLVLNAPAGDQYLWSNGDTTMQTFITQGGTYNVTVTNENACSTISNSINITQDPDETPFITASGPATFCSGGTLILYSSDAESYLWSNGTTSKSTIVFQSGIYTVTVPGYCGDFTSDPIIVNVVEVPDPIAINDTLTSIPDVATLSAATSTGTNLGWFWYDAPIDGNLLSTDSIFETDTLFQTSSFYVQAISEADGVNCPSDRVEVLAVVDTTLSVNQFNDFENIVVYPNPASQEVVIDFKNGIPFAFRLELIDINGKTVFSKKMENSNQPIDEIISLVNIPSGVYAVAIKSDENQFVQKLLIQKD